MASGDDEGTEARQRVAPEGDPRRYVYVNAAKCPHCASTNIKAYGKLRPDEDGSIRRYTRCDGCSARFIVIETGGPIEPTVDRTGEIPVVSVKPVCCPSCGSTKIRRYGAVPTGNDENSKLYAQCRDCAQRFYLVVPKRNFSLRIESEK